MRLHPVFSADIIRPLFPEALVDGVRHHHEHYDGKGYPDGLAGEDIPLLARGHGRGGRLRRHVVPAAVQGRAHLRRVRGRTAALPRRRSSTRRWSTPSSRSWRSWSADARAGRGHRRRGGLPHPRRQAPGAARTRGRGDARVRGDPRDPARGARRQPAHPLPHHARADRQEVRHRRRPRGERGGPLALRRRVLHRRRAAAGAGGPAAAGEHRLRRPVRRLGHRSRARSSTPTGRIVAAVAADLPALSRPETEALRGDVRADLRQRCCRPPPCGSAAPRSTPSPTRLTGLYNHRYLHERLSEELHRAARVGPTADRAVLRPRPLQGLQRRQRAQRRRPRAA